MFKELQWTFFKKKETFIMAFNKKMHLQNINKFAACSAIFIVFIFVTSRTRI